MKLFHVNVWRHRNQDDWITGPLGQRSALMTALFQIQQLNIWLFVSLSLVLLHTCHFDHPGGKWGERIQGDFVSNVSKRKKVKKTLIAHVSELIWERCFRLTLSASTLSRQRPKSPQVKLLKFFCQSVISFCLF